MTSDKLVLEDVRFWAQHGLSKEEQSVGAWFSVDAELAVDLRAAALSDDVAATVDYGLVMQRIVEIGTTNRVNLLERLASLMSEAILREFPASAVRLRLRKLTPPGGLVGVPGVEVTRTR
jgi:7,8-dihydroneopterin aldolase/epimerase/oxygenase